MTLTKINPKRIELSIIIVSYNTMEFTLECLQSVFRQTRDVSFEVIVFDNLENGHSEAIHPRSRLIKGILRNNKTKPKI